MRPQYLTALEHEPLTIGNDGSPGCVTPAEADRLVVLGEMRPGFCQRAHRSIRLAQYCGIVGLGGRILEILPKVDDRLPPEECRGVLLRLLRAAGAFPLFSHLEVGQRLQQATLLEVFITAFFDAVTAIVRAGLLRRYHEREEDLRLVRGRIVTNRQFAALANRPDLITCRYDDLSADNAWNRILKAGVLAVGPWISSEALARRCIELRVVFDEVDGSEVTLRSIDRLVFDRHGERYRAAIGWARWILSLLSPSLRAGAQLAPSLLFDTNLLFQSAIASRLRRRLRAHSPTTRVETQVVGQHLAVVAHGSDRRAFALRPDIVLRTDGQVATICDTKWKHVGISRHHDLVPTEADMYQMHAYAAAFGCGELALIYPWHEGLSESRETSFDLPVRNGSSPRVSVVCIDVRSDRFSVLRGRDTLGGLESI